MICFSLVINTEEIFTNWLSVFPMDENRNMLPVVIKNAYVQSLCESYMTFVLKANRGNHLSTCQMWLLNVNRNNITLPLYDQIKENF